MNQVPYVFVGVLIGVLIGYFVVPYCQAMDNGRVTGDSYDADNPAYKFIPAAPGEWIERFGDNERTRLLHTISELRVVVADQGRRLIALEKEIDYVDINPKDEGEQQHNDVPSDSMGD